MLMTDDTLITLLYVLVDDWFKAVGHKLVASRPGPKPRCSDSEVLTVMLAREWLGARPERAFLAWLRANQPRLFPHLPDDGGFNKRARSLWRLLDAFRTWLVAELDTSVGVVDTTPVPVVKLARATIRKVFRGEDGAGRGFSVVHKALSYGYKLVLLNTLEGVPVLAALVPADVDDREAGIWLLEGGGPGLRLADKGFQREELFQELRREGQRLLVPPKRNSRRQPWPPQIQAWIGRLRRRVESAISILKRCYRLEEHGAKTLSGLAARVVAKLLALTLRRQGLVMV
jgi:hypothetical protein